MLVLVVRRTMWLSWSTSKESLTLKLLSLLSERLRF